MIKSMTGYGRANMVIDGMDILFEIKSVNHRYFEYNSRIPRTYSYLDDFIKQYIQKSISRGKVDVLVTVDIIEGDAVDIRLDTNLLEGYLNALKKISADYELRDDISVTSVARLPDVFNVKKQDEDREKLTEAVRQVADVALAEFVGMRTREGAKLYDDLIMRADNILASVEKIEKRSPEAVSEYAAKLEARIKELIGSATVDENRLLTEVAIYADKISITEEIVRLKSHLSQFESMIKEKIPVGRKIDFLIQELNREINTIGSKANDLEIAREVVEVKAEIEKIREQIQNIE